jgi:5'-nucleotidase
MAAGTRAAHPEPTMHRLLRLAALLAAALLAACTTPGPGSAPPGPAAAAPDHPAPLVLHIAHINDHHSQLEPFAGTELRLDGVPTRVELGGFARQAAVFRALEATTPHLLKLHAGDALTGSLYYTFFKGEADARLMDTVCFDAFIPGNHEFDDGDERLRDFLDALGRGPCPPPVLSANVVPAAGSPLAPAGRAPYLLPSVVRRIGGVDVGLVGLTVAGKTQASSRPKPPPRRPPSTPSRPGACATSC